MKRNLVIFLIIIILFIVIATVGYLIFMFQSRLGIRPGSSTSSGGGSIA
jgi:flagellar basal body-associated protein FliL